MRSEAAGRGLVVALLAAAAVLAVSGCPFTPRDAPPPCTPGVDPGCNTVVPLDPPLTAEIAFENIRKALRKRGTDGPNIDFNYRESLSESFVYVPDADALSVSANRPCPQPFFAGWGRERSVQFMKDVLELGTPAIPDTVDLTYLRKVERDEIPDLDVTRYEVDYVLTWIRKASATEPREVRCYAATSLWDFSGVQRQDFRLIRWEDLAVLPDASCPGGTVPGTLGMFRATDGRCLE